MQQNESIISATLAHLPSPYISVVANGVFPTNTIIMAAIPIGQLTIACDGGFTQLAANGLRVDFIVGDKDSLDNSCVSNYLYDANQSTNDLTKAIMFAANHAPDCTNLVIFAANGLREDHAVANFFLSLTYLSWFKNVTMISDYGVLSAHHAGEFYLPTVICQQISFFSPCSTTAISCAELKWPLQNFTLVNLYAGSLNQAISKQINCYATDRVLVYRAFSVKDMSC
jgi:thiamine pyrophosphokinase